MTYRVISEAVAQVSARQARASRQVAAYRSNHVIEVEYPKSDGVARCHIDGFKVYPIKGGRWRHDISEIERAIGQSMGVL